MSTFDQAPGLRDAACSKLRWLLSLSLELPRVQYAISPPHCSSETRGLKTVSDCASELFTGVFDAVISVFLLVVVLATDEEQNPRS